MRRRRRDTLEALWWMTVLLVGIPVGLLRLPGRPTLPRHLPTHEQWVQLLQQPLTPATALSAMVITGWFLWAVLLYVAGRDLLRWAATLTRRLPRPRLPGPLQSLSAAVLGAVAVSSTTAGAAHAAVHSRPAPTSTGPGPLLRLAADTRPATPVAVANPAGGLGTAGAAVAPATLAVPVDDRHDSYTVRPGDTLWHLARQRLGDPQRWPEIYHLNQAHYDQHGRMRGGDHIEPGWVLVLPADATPPADVPAAAPPGPPPNPAQPSSPAATPAPSAPANAGQPPSSAPPAAANGQPRLLPAPDATSTGTDTDRSATSTTQASPSPRTTRPPSPQARSDTPTSDQSERQRPSNNGIEVPGGWLTAGLGAALLFAVAIVWRRRRHRYAPTPITTAILDDPDLAPPLAARTLIRQRLRRAAPTPDLDEPAPEAGPTVREYVEAERAGVQALPELPPLGPTGPELAGLGVVPLTGGLGLDGDAALDAARALLIATLSCGHAGDPDARGQVVIPAATLASLIGVTAVDLKAMDRLIVTDTFADAVSYLEEEIIRRSRTIADAQVADVAALRAENAFAAPQPQLLLVAETPEPVWRDRVATALGLGEHVDIAAVFIGPWTTTLTVAADGTTGDGDGHRVAVLDAESTAEAAGMLREAHSCSDSGSSAVLVPTSHVSARAWGRPQRDAQEGTQANPDPEEIAAIEPAAGDGAQPTAVASVEPIAERVRVRVLGHPAVLDAGGQPMPKLRAKSLELLVYLAVNRSGASLSDIMEAIWPDATLRRAAERLSTCVANLRGVIRAVAATTMSLPGDTDLPTRQKLEPVINSGGFYRLDPTIVCVDWWTVLDEYGRVAAARDDQDRLGHLLAATADLRGSLAEGTDYDWIDIDRERVRRYQIRLLAHAAELLAADDVQASRTLLDQACTLDPLSDELARRAMRAAAAVGDADGIRHRLDTLRHALEDADIDLDADTEQLAGRLLHDLEHRRQEHQAGHSHSGQQP